VRIAVLYICTGDYVKFWPGFYQSAETHFLPEVSRHHFVFTDGQVEPAKDITVVPQDSLGWPFNTLYRFRMFLRLRQELQSFSNVVFLNANCVVQRRIGFDEFFAPGSDLVACRHPGFFDKPTSAYTYERRPQSKAHVAQGAVYRAGGLMGGTVSAFLAAADEIAGNIEADLENGLVALWHDESHWNAYLDSRAPAAGRVVHDLSPGFLYPEGWTIPFEPRILLREKSKVIDVNRIKGQGGKGDVAPPRGILRQVADRIWPTPRPGR
jgi:hypothetical protein